MTLTPEQWQRKVDRRLDRLDQHSRDLLNTRNKFAYAAINEVYARCPGDRYDLSEVEDVLCSVDNVYRSLQRGANVSDGQRQANRIIIERAVRSGQRYWLPAGTYEIDRPITIRTAQHINLAGDAGRTFIKTATGDAVFDVQFPSVNRKSVFFHGISLAAEGSTLTHLMKVRYASSVFAQGCSGKGETYRHKLFLIQFCNNVQLEQGVGLSNCTFARVQNCTNVRIQGLQGRSSETIPYGEQNADMAFVNIEFSDDWKVEDVEIEAYGHGVQWWGGDAAGGGGGNATYWLVPAADHQCKNGTIRNVKASNMYWSCVWGSAGENIRVYDCDAYRCGDVGLDSEGGKRIKFINCTAEDCGGRTGGGNFGAFFLNSELEYINCTSTVNNATIIHEEAGTNPNIPAGKPKYNHIFHILDYIGYRCESITYKNCKFITYQGVSQPWMYGDCASIKLIDGCEFRNFSLNFGANRGYYREISDFTFELTESVPNGVGLIATAVGDSKEGIGNVKAIAYNTMLPYTLPFVLNAAPVESTVPKEPGPGIDNIPGKTIIRNGEIRVKPGVAPSDKNIVGITTFCYDTTGNQELYVEGVRVYGCNIDVNTKCTVKDLAQAHAPKLYIKNNTFESGKLVREEPTTGARSFFIWEGNKYTSSYEVNLTNALTNIQLINLTPTASDLHSDTDRYYYLGSFYGPDNPSSFAKISGLVLHYSNNFNNAAEDSYNITFRGDNVIVQNHLKGLYALDQRSCTLEVHEGGTDVGSVADPKKKLYQLWACIADGFNSLVIEVPVGVHLIYEDIRPYVSTSAPAGALKYHTLWGKPTSWAATSGQFWTKIRTVNADPVYVNLPEEYSETIWDSNSDRPNVVAKAYGKPQKSVLYKPLAMSNGTEYPTGAAQQAAGNFSLSVFSEYRGFYERYGIGFSDFMALTRKAGVSVHSGNGTATVFETTHGLGRMPIACFAQAWSDDADNSNIKKVTCDTTKVYVSFKVAPVSGTDNVLLNWLVL